MNREQRRAAGKGQDDQRMEVTGVVVHFKNGQYTMLDTRKIMILDRDTQRPIFDFVIDIEPQPGDIVVTADADTPDHSAPLPFATAPSQEFPDDSTQQYTVQFDTPEGKMEYVKKGNFSGIRPVKE